MLPYSMTVMSFTVPPLVTDTMLLLTVMESTRVPLAMVEFATPPLMTRM